MSRWRVVGWSMVMGLLLALASREGQAAGDPIPLRAKPVHLSPLDPSVTRIGRLEYLGGVALSSSDGRFGGLSGMLVSGDGARLIAVSDHGWWVNMRLAYDAAGLLTGAGDAAIEPMRGISVRSLANLPAGDAESLTTSGGDGVIVGFETRPRLWRYPSGGKTPVPLPAPPDLSRAPRNEGVEALTRLKDGRLLAISEGLAVEGGYAGWIGREQGGWARLTWQTGQGFQATDAVTMPNGDVLVLERRILPPGARVRLVKAPAIAPGAVLSGEEIGRLEGALTFDNMEGIAVRLDPAQGTLVYLLSDDNYAFFQRTLLLMFRLIG